MVVAATAAVVLILSVSCALAAAPTVPVFGQTFNGTLVWSDGSQLNQLFGLDQKAQVDRATDRKGVDWYYYRHDLEKEYDVRGTKCTILPLPKSMGPFAIPADSRLVGRTMIRGRMCDDWQWVKPPSAVIYDLWVDPSTRPFPTPMRRGVTVEGKSSLSDYVTFTYLKSLPTDQLLPPKEILDKCRPV